MRKMASILILLCLFQSSPAFGLSDAIKKVKDKYLAWVPSWQEVAFIVNCVSIYTKVRDIVYNMAYQVRLIQSTVRLIERQAAFFERTKGMMEQIGKRGFTLYDLEMTFRDVAYLTGPEYQYLLYLSGRTVSNAAAFVGSMGNYTDPSTTTFEQRMALNSAVFGDPNTVSFDLASRGVGKEPYLYEANLSEISDCDALIAHCNSSLEDVGKEKKDMFMKFEDQPGENLNNNKIIQQIVLLNIKRAQMKVNLIDNLEKRNEAMAYRLLSQSYLKKQTEVFDKYKNAGSAHGLE